MRVGLNLPQYEIDFGGGITAGALASIARRAESLGFDSLWVSDHPFAFAPDGSASGALEVLTTLGFLAGVTERIGLGTLVLAASMREPAQVAAAAEALSGREVTIGIGAGWYAPEHTAFGAAFPPLAERLDRLEAHLRAVRGRARVLVGGTGAGVRALAAAYADAWNVAWDVPVPVFTELRAMVDVPSASVGVTVLVGEEDELPRAVERMRARAPFMRDVDLEQLRASIIVGDPAACARRIAAYACDEVVVTIAARDDEAMLERFGREVLPALRATGILGDGAEERSGRGGAG